MSEKKDFKSYEYNKGYIKNYLQSIGEIKVRMPMEHKNEITEHAAKMGESVNGFINRAITETMERDKAKDGE